MPPRTRGSKPAKALKENIGVIQKAKAQATSAKVARPARKALADKTNSASDDNASVEILKQSTKKPISSGKIPKSKNVVETDARPRRERRLPGRFVENNLLKNLSNNNNNSTTDSVVTKTSSTAKRSLEAKSSSSSSSTSFKTPQKPAETSLVANRPRRICRLPSKFEDHSISPSKFVPVQPVHASTPKVQKVVLLKQNSAVPTNKQQKVKNAPKPVVRSNEKAEIKTKPVSKNASIAKPVTDLPVNTNRGRTLRTRKAIVYNTSSVANLSADSQKSSPHSKHESESEAVNRKKVLLSKSPIKKHLSFRVLEDRNSPKQTNNDVYEFTFDPSEEPPPQKKKKKRIVKKQPRKPKTVVFKNNYDNNLSKSLLSLKTAVARKAVGGQVTNKTTQQNVLQEPAIKKTQNTITTNNLISDTTMAAPMTNGTALSTTTNKAKSTIPVNNKSVQIEDIAADFEITMDENINYSPVNSPFQNRPQTPLVEAPSTSLINDDPLNLRDNLSFFDAPVASSSMRSVRDPQASPWRVEFDKMPIKWHVNTYVKANMTPAVECSFVNFEGNQKKHVYTNIVPEAETSEPFPQIAEKSNPNLIQTSIISFIKEVEEKKALRAQRARSRSKTPLSNKPTEGSPPTQTHTNANQIIDIFAKNTRTVVTPKKIDNNVSDNVPSDNTNTSNANESSSTTITVNSNRPQKRKNNTVLDEGRAKTPRTETDTYFGFDESDVDQENVSPSKNVNAKKVRSLRPRARAVLKEINQLGPTRAVVPLVAKTKNSEAINRLYEEMKSASDAPMFPEKNAVDIQPATQTTNLDMIDDDSQSVHLFEDIEVVHHLKPQRKSYSKAKKVTFRQQSTSDSDMEINVPAEASSGEEDDLADLTFEMPTVEEKKAQKKKNKIKKQKLTKKEREEVETWAANFNSMCEDVEDFPLVIE